MMLVPLLARLLLAGPPLVVPVQAPAVRSSPPPGAAARIAVRTDRDAPYRRGQSARISLHTDAPSYVALFRVDTDGRIRVLFPREPSGARERSARHEAEVFRVDDDPGIGYVLAIAAGRPLDFRPITRGRAWDYRPIGGGHIRGDPYVALTDLAARLAPAGDYAYDIAPYYVERRYDYPRFVCYQCHAQAGYDEWDPYAAACSRYQVIVRDGPGDYPYRYGGRDVVAERPAHPGPRFVFREAGPPPEGARGIEPRGGAPRSTGEPELRRRRRP
jgi:hypothetical protein